jgi:hypothetical protein
MSAVVADGEESVAEGGDGVEERLGRGGQVLGEDDRAVGVEDDEEEGPGVQVGAGVESSAGRWSEGAHGEGPRLWERRRAVPMIAGKAVMSIQTLQM